VLAADCKSVPEEAGCSIQHTLTTLMHRLISGEIAILSR